MSRNDEFVHGVLHRFAEEGEFYHPPRNRTYKVSDLTTRGRASGKCESCADAADDYFRSNGIDAEPARYTAINRKRPAFGAYHHRVSVVNINDTPHAVDYTFNQFHPGAQIPHVEPLEDFDQRMLKKKFERRSE
jgi:hypothetical protein